MGECLVTPRGDAAHRLPARRFTGHRTARFRSPGGPEFRSRVAAGTGTIRLMISIRPSAVDAPDAVALVRSYLTEMVDRYHGRPMPSTAVDEALAAEPADDLAVLLIAYREGTGIGCVGLRRAEERTGEITKMYVAPGARRLGVGRRLLAAVEDAARDRGLRTLRLDTRDDLVEARAMYAAGGYAEIPPHEDRLYADHWFAKDLTP